MPLWRIATAPDELDNVDSLVDASMAQESEKSEKSSIHGGDGLHHRHSGVPASPRTPESTYNPTGPFLIKTDQPADTNKNTSWFLYPGVWTMYFMTVILAWLFMLSMFGCTAGTAWNWVNIVHFAVTFYLFHWKKGSPFSEDQGVYDKLTWWEQLDEGRQFTKTRKFLTCVPVCLYLITSYATRHSEYSNSILIWNTVMVALLIIAKLPVLHQVRLFGINAGYPS